MGGTFLTMARVGGFFGGRGIGSLEPVAYFMKRSKRVSSLDIPAHHTTTGYIHQGNAGVKRSVCSLRLRLEFGHHAKGPSRFPLWPALWLCPSKYPAIRHHHSAGAASPRSEP